MKTPAPGLAVLMHRVFLDLHPGPEKQEPAPCFQASLDLGASLPHCYLAPNLEA